MTNMFTAAHLELHVRDLDTARHFYVDQLGLEPLQETPAMRLLAVRAGNIRLSIFAREDAPAPGPSQLILATPDLDASIARLAAAGLAVDGPPVTAGTFLRFVTVHDPEGNRIALSEYYRDPLAAA